MNIFNRLLALVFFLAVLAAAILTILLVLDVLVTPDVVRQAWPYAPVVSITRDVTRLPSNVRPIVIGCAAAVGVLSIIALIAELRPPRRRPTGPVLLRATGPGGTEVTNAALTALAEYSAGGVPGVEGVRTRVYTYPAALDVQCRATVAPDVDLAAAGPHLAHAMADALGQATGLPMRGVHTRAVVQYPRKTRSRAHRVVK